MLLNFSERLFLELCNEMHILNFNENFFSCFYRFKKVSEVPPQTKMWFERLLITNVRRDKLAFD